MTVPLGRPESNILDPRDMVDRRVLNAERDVARANRRAMAVEHALKAARLLLEETQREKAAERDRTRALQRQIDLIYASTSWRISRPVRAVSSLMHILRRRLHSLPSTMPPSALPAGPGPQDTVQAPNQPVRLGPREQAILQRLQGEMQP